MEKGRQETDISNVAPEIENITSEKAEEAKKTLSAALHENWRADVQKGFVDKGESPDTPRLRVSKDKSETQDVAWYEEQEANGVVFERDPESDKRLVNTNVPYNELSPSWQDANSGAAEFVVDALVDGTENGEDVANEQFVQQLASMIHDKWMEDNSWDRENKPELFVPYTELDPDEQKKDADQVRIALGALGHEQSTS
jgi:hypothetical protein